MTSGGRELLKWIAVLLMTGDHVAKVFYGGYVPVISELGRIAFPVFALVMAYNLAEPNADIAKSIRRLALWAAIAQPAHALAFGHWLPLNVLASFALAASVVWAIRAGRCWLVVALAGPLPLLVDYQWSGIAVVVAGYVLRRLDAPPAAVVGKLLAICLLCLYNGNGWALLALPVMLVGYAPVSVPRTRWAFYGYYVGHLALLAALGPFMSIDNLITAAGWVLAALLLVGIVKTVRTLFWAKRSLRDYDRRRSQR